VQPSSYPPGAGRPDEYNSEHYGRSEGRWDGSGYPTEPVTVRRTRSWAVALAAFVTGLILMAAVGNTSVTGTLDRHAQGHSFKDGVLLSLTTVQWRFGAASGDHARIWVGQLVGDLAALVLIFLLVWIVANGRGSFWQAFFGTWACAVGAFLLATYVNTAVVNTSGSGASKEVVVFFAQNTATSTFALFGALMYGFVIALVAGLVAWATRKSEVMVDASAAAAPGTGYYPPAQGQGEGAGYPPAPVPAASPAQWAGDRPGGDQPTEALPRTEDQDRSPNQTAVLPSVGGPDQQGSGTAGPPYGTSPSDQYGSPYGGSGPQESSTQTGETPPETRSSTESPATESPATESPATESSSTEGGAGAAQRDDAQQTTQPPRSGESSGASGPTSQDTQSTDSNQDSRDEPWPPQPRRES
jgi:hypothetical protein